jgi:hypothetical protein
MNKRDFIAREAESTALNQRMGQIYQVTKQLSGIKAQVNMTIKDKNNNILTTEREQYLRWKEHFQDPHEASMDLEIETDPPSKLEIQKAIKIWKNKKAPGTDQLNAELFKIDPVLAAEIYTQYSTKYGKKLLYLTVGLKVTSLEYQNQET